MSESNDDMHERETEPNLETAKPKTSLMYEELKKVLPDRTITDEDVARLPGKSLVAKVLEEIVQEPVDEDNVVPLMSRQQRRAAERVAAKEAEQSLVSITTAQLEKLHRARIMLAALVRREGRVRIPQKELTIRKGDQLDVKVQDNGDLVVTYKAG